MGALEELWDNNEGLLGEFFSGIFKGYSGGFGRELGKLWGNEGKAREL